jgi:hypothetical protein
MIRLPLLLQFALTLMPVFAGDTDLRLATAKKAFVRPFDEVGDDTRVAECFVDHLTNTTSLAAVDSKDEADVLISIRVHLRGTTSRPLFYRPNVRLVATSPDGTRLWSGIRFFRRNESLRQQEPLDSPCALADGIADELKQAIDRARAALKR